MWVYRIDTDRGTWIEQAIGALSAVALAVADGLTGAIKTVDVVPGHATMLRSTDAHHDRAF